MYKQIVGLLFSVLFISTGSVEGMKRSAREIEYSHETYETYVPSMIYPNEITFPKITELPPMNYFEFPSMFSLYKKPRIDNKNFVFPTQVENSLTIVNHQHSQMQRTQSQGHRIPEVLKEVTVFASSKNTPLQKRNSPFNKRRFGEVKGHKYQTASAQETRTYQQSNLNVTYQVFPPNHFHLGIDDRHMLTYENRFKRIFQCYLCQKYLSRDQTLQNHMITCKENPNGKINKRIT